MAEQPNLSDIRNQLYNKAEKYWWLSLSVSLGIPLLTLATLILKTSNIQIYIGFAAIISPVGLFWLRNIAEENSTKADKCRRVILYADGLNHPITHEDQMKIRACTLKSDIRPAEYEKPYYESNYEPGPKRLVEITKQSAFFTSMLAKEVSETLTKILIFFGIVILAIIYLGLPMLEDTKKLSLIAKSATIIISTLYAGDLIWLKNKFADLHNESEAIISQSIPLLQKKELTESEAFRLVEDYHITINLKPPIPNRVYKKHVERLNKIYRESNIPVGE